MQSIFDTVLCGVDESPVALEALFQAQRLLEPAGRLVVVASVEKPVAVAVGRTSRGDENGNGPLHSALAYAHEHYGSEGILVHGDATKRLVEVAQSERASLVAIGARGSSRAAGLLLGHTATGVVRKAPCSVLVVRTPRIGLSFPSSIVVGVDGSAPSLVALEAAKRLGRRLDAPVRVLIARGDGDIAAAALRGVEHLEWTDEKPAEALTTASAGADLVVVGSRGLHGVAALGSVSERVAHGAYSSVLVVREP